MRGFSKVILAGNLTRDPELRTTASGSSVCSFSLAVNRRIRTASGEDQERTSFFDCSAWGRSGETIEKYLRKGQPLLVSGRLDQRTWEDKNGQKRSSVEVFVEEFTFIGGGGDGGANGYSRSGGSSSSEMAPRRSAENIPEDIPDEAIDVTDIPF